MAAEVCQAGRRVLTALVDMRSAEEIATAVEAALRSVGRIDVLVNNAAAPPGADRASLVDLPSRRGTPSSRPT